MQQNACWEKDSRPLQHVVLDMGVQLGLDSVHSSRRRGHPPDSLCCWPLQTQGKGGARDQPASWSSERPAPRLRQLLVTARAGAGRDRWARADGRWTGWILTGQVVFPPVRLPERTTVAATSSRAASASGPRPSTLLHHFPAPPTRNLGRRHSCNPPRPPLRLSGFPVRAGAPRSATSLQLARRRKASWDL